MCKLRPGAPQDQEGEEVEVESEVEGIYERIETVVVQVNFVKKISEFNLVGQCNTIVSICITWNSCLGWR